MPKFDALTFVTGLFHRTKLNGLLKSAPSLRDPRSCNFMVLLMEAASEESGQPLNQSNVRAVFPRAYVAGLWKAAGLINLSTAGSKPEESVFNVSGCP